MIKKLFAAACLAALLAACGNAAGGAKKAAPAFKILNAYALPSAQNFDRGGNTLSLFPGPYSVNMKFENTPPENAVYSLYTYKKTFAQGGKRNYMQGIRECDPIDPLATQEDVDKNLDKIYETRSVTPDEYQPYGAPAPDKYLKFDWDGYTDPRFTGGTKYPVRDCLVITARDGKGKLVSLKDLNTAAESYSLTAGADFTAGDNSVSATVYVPEGKPVKKISALIMTENCGIGALTFDTVNKGAAAVVADIRKRLVDDVPAYTELTNPAVSADNNSVKIYKWTDIRGVGGKYFVPEKDKRYRLALILETDAMTFTGIKDGYIYDGVYQNIPSPKKLKAPKAK